MKTSYVNMWQREVALLESSEAISLDLPDGMYRLVIRDADRTRFEIVDALVEAGSAELTRALEGTEPQEWPEGSVIYCALTAEQIGFFAGISGEGSPVGVEVAPGGTIYINEMDDGVWIRGGAGWVNLAAVPVTPWVGSATDLDSPENGEWLMGPGAVMTFSFEGTVYSNVPLQDEPRRFEAEAVTHVSMISSGGRVALIATPLVEYFADPA